VVSRMSTLAKICERYNVSLMYLFGSREKLAMQIIEGSMPENRDPLADIDVGVVFSTALPVGRERARLYSLLFNDLEDVFLPFALDLVFLEENHAVFQAEAVKGQCVYAASTDARLDYEEAILRRACDFRPFLEMYYAERLGAKT